MAAEKFPQSIKCEISPVQAYLKEKSDFQESYATLLQGMLPNLNIQIASFY